MVGELMFGIKLDIHMLRKSIFVKSGVADINPL
jgi:hypothetical protein